MTPRDFSVVSVYSPHIGRCMSVQFAVLGAVAPYAFAGVFGRRFRSMKISPVTTAAGQVTALSMTLVPLVIVFEWSINIQTPSACVWAAISVSFHTTWVGCGRSEPMPTPSMAFRQRRNALKGRLVQ